MNALLYTVYVIVDDNVDNHRDRNSVCYAILYISTHAVHSSIITYLCHCHCHCHPRRPVLTSKTGSHCLSLTIDVFLIVFPFLSQFDDHLFRPLAIL